ncbi:MarR family transcriptional regulator [Actinomadura bangladeshensis]|uniref:MarR family transcriptional regulator n=1 Tax=Actinomadura bangladeshensis TaxID=453573 RepID=A0A6L9QCE5_9ACTN|nr:MarR family transcriptional regulator [Actinomadura bangladeshensis]NEA23141.1 MarR family transcriptional regulator [Actinomadura bangladeshensis]
MSTDESAGPDVDDGIRTMLLLMPRLVSAAKKIKVPAELASFDLAPRHLSLLAYLLFDGPMTVNALAGRLEVAPATVSLMVGDLSRQGILERREDPDDRRRTIVSVADAHLPAINGWLGQGAGAWRAALEPLAPDQRKMFIDTLLAYERAVTEARGG